MPTEFFAIGPLSIDYLVTSDGNLHEAILGGGAVYSSVGARLISKSVSIVSTISPNFPSHYLEDINTHDIETKHIFTRDYCKDPIFFSASNAELQKEDVKATQKYKELGLPIPKALFQSGATQNKPFQQWELNCSPKELPPAIAGSLIVHFACPGPRTIKQFGQAIQQSKKPIVSFEPPSSMMKRDSTAELRLALHDVDIFLTSENHCQELFRPELPDIWVMAEKLAAMGPDTVVLKRGEHGQAVLDANKKRRWFVPAYPTRAVDLTGAGHTYSGAFAATFATTDGDVQRGAASASAAASMAVEGVGYSYAMDSTPGLIKARRDRIIEGIHQA